MKSELSYSKVPNIIITDYDGCHPGDCVWLNQEGEEFIAANKKDGLAVKRLINLGIEIVIASIYPSVIKALLNVNYSY